MSAFAAAVVLSAAAVVVALAPARPAARRVQHLWSPPENVRRARQWARPSLDVDLLRTRFARRRDAEERARAVEACAAIRAELQAGRPLATALRAGADVARGPTRDVLVAAADLAHAGGDPALALARPGRSAVPSLLHGLAVCWTVCAATGSGLASAIERLEEGHRAAESQRRAVRAELAGPRATARLLAALPLLGLGLATALGARPFDVLLHTPLGLACLVLGVGLDAAGVVWTGRLARRAEQSVEGWSA